MCNRLNLLVFTIDKIYLINYNKITNNLYFIFKQVPIHLFVCIF